MNESCPVCGLELPHNEHGWPVGLEYRAQVVSGYRTDAPQLEDGWYHSPCFHRAWPEFSHVSS